MDTSLLRDFVVFARYLNFTSAARALSVSQSTLSRHIAELERFLGAELVVRGERQGRVDRVALTPCGEALLEEADALMSAEDRLLQRVRQVRGTSARVIRIEEYPYSQTVTNLLADAASRAQVAGTRILTEFVPTKGGPTIEEAVLDGYFDVAVTVHLCRDEAHFEPYEGIEYLPVPNLASRLCFYLASDNPLLGRAADDRLALADLSDERFVLPLRPEFGNFRHDFGALCREAGFEPQFVLKRTHSMSDLGCMDMHGLAQVITEADVASPDSMFLRGDGCRVVACSDDLFAVPALVFRSHDVDPSLAVLIEELRRLVERDPRQVGPSSRQGSATPSAKEGPATGNMAEGGAGA